MLRLDRLLVEPGRLVPLAVEAVAADRPEVALGRGLDVDQPAQGVQADLDPARRRSRPAGDQGVRDGRCRR